MIKSKEGSKLNTTLMKVARRHLRICLEQLIDNRAWQGLEVGGGRREPHRYKAVVVHQRVYRKPILR